MIHDKGDSDSTVACGPVVSGDGVPSVISSGVSIFLG
jgi:hypothetical protein